MLHQHDTVEHVHIFSYPPARKVVLRSNPRLCGAGGGRNGCATNTGGLPGRMRGRAVIRVETSRETRDPEEAAPVPRQPAGGLPSHGAEPRPTPRRPPASNTAGPSLTPAAPKLPCAS